jgi:predicted RNA polymerase sigma factor
MPASKQMRLLSVRLPEAELRRFKSLAASRGVTLQDALHQALDAWARSSPRSSPESLDALEGSLRDVDVNGLRRSEREAELGKERPWS